MVIRHKGLLSCSPVGVQDGEFIESGIRWCVFWLRLTWHNNLWALHTVCV